MIDLRNFNEFHCPDCGKASHGSERIRYTGVASSAVRADADANGMTYPMAASCSAWLAAPHFIYTPKLMPLPCAPRFTVGGW